MREGLHSVFKELNYLSDDNVQKMHEGIISVLSKVGVTVEDNIMREVLKEYGCSIDNKLQRVYFTEDVLKRALKTTPNGFLVKARNDENDIIFKPGKNTLFLNAAGQKLYDYKTKTVKEPTRKEFYEYIKLLDALPNIDIQNCFPMFGFEGVPQTMRLLESAAAKLRMSTKVQIEGTTFDNYIFLNMMAQELNIEICQIVNSAAPLTYYSETAKQIRNYAKSGMPVHFAAGPLRGFTSPISPAGAVINNHAETLAGLVMLQALKPGSRIWMNSMILTPDMQTGNPSFGNIYNSVTDIIHNQMWNHYGIPSWSNAASWTSSKEIDYQAGYELILALLSQVLSRASAVSFQGGLNAEITISPEKAVIDDDIVGMVKQLVSLPDFSDDGFSLDLIHEIGPVPGSFLQTDETLFNWQNSCYVPNVASTEIYAKWERGGKKSIIDRAHTRVNQILSQHNVEKLSNSQEEKLEQILNEARTYYYKKGLIPEDEWILYQESIHSDTYPYA
jgi:trimethylamine--corrinoid protein Co-methyltransferase